MSSRYFQFNINAANSFEDLVAYENEEFIYCVYVTLLARRPDIRGFIYYLNRLKKGVEKAEIIYQVYSSKEARKNSVSVLGLDTEMRKLCFLRLPLLGALLKKTHTNLVKEPEKLSRLQAVIINFTGDRGNWGCQATSWELLKFIRQAFGDRLTVPYDFVPLFPRCRVDFDLDASFGVAVESALAAVNPTEAQLQLLLDIAEQRYGHYLDKIRNADIVFFQAEGTLTGSDMLHGWRLLLLPYIAKKVFVKTVVSLNQTIFWKKPVIDDFVLNVLRSFDLVAVREPTSLAYLRSVGCLGACLIPDAAFLAPAVLSGNGLPSLDKNQHYFAVTGSAVLQYFTIEAMLLLVEEIKTRYNLVPVFVCSAGFDLQLLAHAKTRWGNEVLSVAPSSNYRAVAAIIQQCDFLLGGRYHMAILSATVRTPLVLLPSNTPKNEGLLVLLDYPLDVRQVDDLGGIMEDVQAIMTSPDFFKCALDRGLKNVSELINSGKQLVLNVCDKACSISDKQKDDSKQLRLTSLSARAFVDDATMEFYRNRIVEQEKGYDYPEGLAAAFPPSPPLLNIVLPIIVNLRRGIEVEESMILLRHAVEGNIDEICKQLDTRWLVSICDTYAEFGGPIERRNAFFVSMLAILEKTSQTYAFWRLGYPQSLDTSQPLEHRKVPLWDGMDSFHLVHGDVTINMFRRLESLLIETPCIEQIYRRVKEAIKNNETILGTLNKHHKHVFETDYSWILDDEYAELRKSGEIPLSKYQQFEKR